MEQRIYLLGDVARVLRVKPHHVTYALASGGVPEPRMRLGNRRVFTSDDLQRLAEHLDVVVNEDAIDVSGGSPNVWTVQQDETFRPEVEPILDSPFNVSRSGTTCHEVRDGHGDLFAWTP